MAVIPEADLPGVAVVESADDDDDESESSGSGGEEEGREQL